MTLEQKRGSEEYRVEVKDQELTYHSKTHGNEGSATVPFELLSRKTTRFSRANPFFRNAAVYFGILVVVTVAFGFLVDLDPLAALLWGALSAASYLVYRLTGVNYDVFPLADGRVFRLMRGRPSSDAYEEFTRELFERRDAYLLDRYARVDIDRPARLERRRIEWLHDEGVIDESAFTTIVETIEDHASGSSVSGLS